MRNRSWFGLIFLQALLARAEVTPENIQSAVSEYLSTHIKTLINGPHQKASFDIHSIDSRLRLEDCGHPLRVKARENSASIGRITLQVQCEAPKPWQTYVPANIKLFDRVVVSAQPLPKDASLSKNNLVYTEMEVSRLYRGYFSDISKVAGQQLKRSIAQGRVIPPGLLAAPKVVHKNQSVTITSNHPLLKIKTTGTALSDGGLGDFIHVRNNSSAKIIDARVIGPGLVEVNP